MAGGKRTVKKKSPGSDVYKLYADALSQIHKRKFDAANKVLDRIHSDFPKDLEILDRVRVLQKVCQRNLDQSHSEETCSAQAVYDLGVYHHNNHEFDKALECFRKALKNASEPADHVYYAIAATKSLQKELDQAAENLQKAIDLREDNRYFAQNDPDFAPLIQSEKARELLNLRN